MKRTTPTRKSPAAHERLEAAVDAIMSDREGRLPRVPANIAPVLRIAADLRGLPDRDFKARLKRELLKSGRAKHTAAISAPRQPKPVPDGYRTATTCLVVRDGANAIDFYKNAFGATELTRHSDPSGNIMHAEIMIGDSRIAIADEDPIYNRSPQSLGGASSIVQLYVDDVDSLAERAVAAGAKVISPIKDWFYGDRAGRLQDPFGHLWNVSTHIEDVSDEEMRRRMAAFAGGAESTPAQDDVAAVPVESAESEPRENRRPGTIMPFMYTDDVARAFDFYREVFGAKEMHRVAQPGGRVSHLQIAIGATNLMLRDATTPDLAEYRAKGFAATPHSLGGSPLHLYVYVPDADAAFARALAGGSIVVDPIDDKEWGDRCGGVQDPSGHIWYIATPLQR